jgi:uncharacterized membrane protein (DUF106 family)
MAARTPDSCAISAARPIAALRTSASGTSMSPQTGALVPYMVLEWLAAVSAFVFGLLLESVTHNLRDLSRAREEARAILDRVHKNQRIDSREMVDQIQSRCSQVFHLNSWFEFKGSCQPTHHIGPYPIVSQ